MGGGGGAGPGFEERGRDLTSLSPTPPPSVDDVLDRLRDNGGRVTPGRRVIVELLLSADGQHLSADDLVEAVRARMPDTAQSTIYRTLSTLEDLGVVTHVHLGHGPATYHLTEIPHRHLVCDGCGAVLDLPDEEFHRFAANVEARYGFVLSGEHFAFPGRCRACHTG